MGSKDGPRRNVCSSLHDRPSSMMCIHVLDDRVGISLSTISSPTLSLSNEGGSQGWRVAVSSVGGFIPAKVTDGVLTSGSSVSYHLSMRTAATT